MTQKILDTERLRLVPLAEEHLEFEVELDSDPEVMRCLARRASSRAEVDQPKIAGEADLGYRLLRRHWRRGYASEGARSTQQADTGVCATRTAATRPGPTTSRSFSPLMAVPLFLNPGSTACGG